MGDSSWCRSFGPAPWVYAAFLLALAPLVRAQASSPELVVTSERQLTGDLERATDLRISGPKSVALAAGKAGSFELYLEPSDVEPILLTPPGTGAEGIGSAGRIAISESHLAAASGIFLVGWRARDGAARFDGREVFEFIEDIDIFEDRMAILGTRRDDKGNPSPDGALAWIGSLGKNLSDLKAIAYSAEGPGPGAMDRCGAFGIGAVRYLSDGKLVVVPGAEPGVFLYDAAGKLIQTWETEPLGIDVRCDFDQEQTTTLSAQPLARWSWLNQFRTVEDVLPTAKGPALVIREVTESGTRWDLTVLSRGQPAQKIPLPITSPSSTAHLRGDVHDSRYVFLLFDSAIFLEPGPRRDAAAPTRLIVLEEKSAS